VVSGELGVVSWVWVSWEPRCGRHTLQYFKSFVLPLSFESLDSACDYGDTTNFYLNTFSAPGSIRRSRTESHTLLQPFGSCQPRQTTSSHTLNVSAVFIESQNAARTG
jgi:hypothetical protein